MILHVTKSRHLGGHRVYVSFNDGTSAEVDLSDSLDGPVFEPLQNVEYFKSFSVVGHTLAWPNGADFAPEYLHLLALSRSTAQLEQSHAPETGAGRVASGESSPPAR